MFAFAPTIAPAAILHGNFPGATVDYLDVSEDTNTGDALPLFGAPTVSGDALDFNPLGFSASASGENGVDQTDGQLLFTIMGKTGNGISNILLAEAGDVSLTGFGTDATFAAVTTNITIDILATDQGPVNINYQTSISNFSPSGGSFGQLTDGGGGPLFSSNWSGAVLIELGPILTNNGHVGEIATKVNVNLDNVLSALSERGTVATIAKKDFDASGFSVRIQTNVPEPATAVLALSGLLALTTGFRRR
ncbi:MAG: hypothetical protein KDA37_08935 [Planctomycetales bacterium]|nr:hypothetical protein [Planctomycetales bacterium]